jgi:hypothetical protein
MESQNIPGHNNKPRSSPIDWHAGFREGIQLALYPYRDSLSFEFEHPLNSQPLRIDAVIIKKAPEAIIDNPIGAIFRGTNIVEYKSPGAYLSISDFHKVGAYARLYSAQNGVETADMSISFVVEAYPRKLLRYLRKEYGFEAQKPWPGIYYIKEDIFATQIIESRRLEKTGGGIWLKDLRRGLNWEQLWEIIELTGKIPEGIPLATFLHTLIQANSPGAKEMMAMSESVVKDLLLEFSEKYGFIAQWEAKGLEKGLEKAARRLKKHGMEPGQIAEALELPLETVFGYLQAQ